MLRAALSTLLGHGLRTAGLPDLVDLEESTPTRPTDGAHIRTLIRTMAEANPRWGAPRIHGELVGSWSTCSAAVREPSSDTDIGGARRNAFSVLPKVRRFIDVSFARIPPAGCKKLIGYAVQWRVRDWRVVYIIDDAAKRVRITRIAHRRARSANDDC